MNLKKHDQDTLIEWGRKREEIIAHIKNHFTSDEDRERFFILIDEYERLSRLRTRIETCKWLLRDPS